ncbi:MAG: ATP phosphoribosyltransferase regulatory subunit, partial [Gammaproteobacteria bacterium SG8_15]
MNNERWVLPEGIEELLPEDAYCIEIMRRQLLDLFSSWGYELVIPPFLEYTESLLTGIGSDLDLQTFKLVDQKSGRMMGIRADMTPQVARIDAHQLGREQPTRLCYMGTVLRTHADDLSNKRSLMQIGAELYGHEGVASDIEVIRLMLAMLQHIGLNDIHLDLGHVDIFRSLTKQAGLNPQQEALLFDALQRKAA